MKVKIKKLIPEATIPSYAKDGDAGLDLVATSKKLVDEEMYGYIEYGTGISIEIPAGFVGLVYPRSSISKTGLFLANAVGVIDSGYRGEIMVRFKHIPDTFDYAIGNKVAQLIIMPYPNIEFEEVGSLTVTDRGHGAFGSTDKV